MARKIIFWGLLFWLLLPRPVSAYEEQLETQVAAVAAQGTHQVNGRRQFWQQLQLLVTKGSLKGKVISLTTGQAPVSNLPRYRRGDKLLVRYEKDNRGQAHFYVLDYIRRSALIWLFLIFAAAALLVARWRGLGSLLGMAASGAVIFWFLLPRLLAGMNPILAAISSALVIIPLTFYPSHGFNRKTNVAIVGTLLALILTGILAVIFVNAGHLTGLGDEAANDFLIAHGGRMNMRSLLLAGIIVGILGVLDDITVAQAAVIQQLKKANPNLKISDLYWRAMSVGQDHIASMVNTLILVYVGASLPLLLLFLRDPHPAGQIINYEIVAGEIVRTLVGSLGLILAVPITTLLAAVWL